MYYEIELLAFGLCAYRADNGEYPEKLEQLIPKYAKSISDDFFSGIPVRYRSEKEGFVLYSIGQNGEDDGGRGYEGGTPYDDIVIQLPLPDSNLGSR